jgi:hypothetical protein
VLGVATLNGSCTTCHTHPNVGNHTDILPLDLGISTPAEGDNVLPVFQVTNRATGRAEEVTDLGLAMITGRVADLGKQKGPTLRALSSRAPLLPQRRGRHAAGTHRLLQPPLRHRLHRSGDQRPAGVPRSALMGAA